MGIVYLNKNSRSCELSESILAKNMDLTANGSPLGKAARQSTDCSTAVQLVTTPKTTNSAVTIVVADPQSNEIKQGTLSTSRQLYSSSYHGSAILSDSQKLLRRIINAPLNKNRIALALCQGLPYALKSQPFWENIHAVPPGHHASFDKETITTTSRPIVTELDDISFAEAAATLHQKLETVIKTIVEDNEYVSSDLSGGMDSTTLACYLDRFQPNTLFYHATTDNPYNP